MKSALRFSLVVLTLLSAIIAGAQCTVTPATPVGAIAGGTVQFSAANCPNPAWSVIGEGSVDATGKYTAPSRVFVQNYSRGAQLHPNNFGGNAYIGRLPVLPTGQHWLDRIATAGAQGSMHTLKFSAGPRFFKGLTVLHSDETTPQQLMHSVFPWGPYQDVPMPFVQPPDVQQQDGAFMYVYGAQHNGTGPDRHLLSNETLGNGLSISQEMYNPDTDSHNTVITPGGVTTLSFDTNVITPLRSGTAIQVNGVTGACAGMNFNGTAGSSFPITIVSEPQTLVSRLLAWTASVLHIRRPQQSNSNGFAHHVTVTIPYNSSACSASNFSSAWLASGASNCQLCNVGTMMSWPNWDNSIYGGTDAAGTSLVGTSLDPQQCYNRVVNHVVDPATGHVDCVSHLIRTTFVNPLLSPRNAGIAVTGDQVTYGHPLMLLTGVTLTNPMKFTSAYNLGTSGLNACVAPTPWLSVNASTCPNFWVVFKGLAGSCAALNDNPQHSVSFMATAVGDTYHFTIPVDGSQFAGCTFNGSQYSMFDWAPYGATFRLKASFNVEGSCTDGTLACGIYKAILYSFQDYGLAPFDGTNGFNDDWNSGVLTNGFEPDEFVNAMLLFRNWYPIEPNLEVVDTSSLMPLAGAGKLRQLNNQQGMTNFRHTQVCVNGTTCVDVNLVGTAIGFAHERLPLIYPGSSWKEPVFVTGNLNAGYSCGFENPVPGASITPDGTITAPASLTAEVAYKEKCTAAADPTVIAYASGYFVPASSDGALRLHFGGENLSYLDTQNNTWWEQVVRRHNAGASQVFESPLGCDYCPLYGSQIVNPQPGWTGVPDGAGLYGLSVSARNDIQVRVALPNGNYNVTVLGEAGLGVSGPGGSVYDVDINGQLVDSQVDSFVRAGGQFKPYQHNYPVMVANGLLDFGVRDRIDSTTAVYGMSPFAALLISPAGGFLPFGWQLPSFPAGLQGQPYPAVSITAHDGHPPYSFTITSGRLPNGITLNDKTFSGTPTEAGSFPFTVKGCDSASACSSQSATLVINPQQIPTLNVSVSPATMTIQAGAPGSTTATTAIGGGFNSSVALSLSGLPTGVTATFTPQTVPAPGAGNSVLSLAVSAATPAGSYPLTVKVSGEGLNASATVTLNVTQQPLQITTALLPKGSVKLPYHVQLAATGGLPPYRWIAATILPKGLLLSSSGVISGTALLAGNYTVSVVVFDQQNHLAKKSFPLTIVGSGPGTIGGFFEKVFHLGR